MLPEQTGRSPAWRWLALAWLLLVVAMLVQQVRFWQQPRVDTDVMALLPERALDLRLQAANERLADALTDDVVVLLSTGNWDGTREAAHAFLASLQASTVLQAAAEEPDTQLDRALALYAPHRHGLLTPSQRRWLQETPPDIVAESALAKLYAPVAGGIAAWKDDPLGLWPAWWQARAGQGLEQRDGLVAVQDEDGRQWALLRLRSTQPAFQLDGGTPIGTALATARAAAQAQSSEPLELHAAGVPLHAEAAASRAAFEVNTIGLGSLLAVLLLAWLAFRSLRPILLVALSLVIGIGMAMAVTGWLFGQIHLLTLVFGASMAGVAEDYGIHYFASRQAQPQVPPRTMMRRLLPALALALVTSVLAYITLGIAPFPGLRQMAVFAATAIIATFVTAVLWFPWLDAGTPRTSRFARAISGSLARWPRWRFSATGVVLALVTLLFIAGGLMRLQANDDLRSLRTSDSGLIQAEARVGSLLGLPSPAQYFLLEAPGEQALLQKEEELTERLRALVDAGTIRGWRAVSDWVPSATRQTSDRALVMRAEAQAREHVAAALGEPAPAPTPTAAATLAPEAVLALPIAGSIAPLWLGETEGRNASVVLLQGLQPANVDAVAAAATGIQGVRWIDRTASYSALLQRYRVQMGWLLLAGYAAVGIALLLRFGRRAWRAWLPTALAALLSLAALGWIGEPLQLFGVLAQLLLLGLGIDYGIFLLEHEGDGASWLAVCLGAASTLLAFGLLSLSTTPALHGFGLTLLFGIGLVWLLSPCFRSPSHPQGTPRASPT